MIFLILDLIISYFTSIPTYFVLINIVLIPKNKLSKLVIITLILDLLILNTYFLNTIIMCTIFLIIKKIKITKINFPNYLISLTLIYIMYIILIGVWHYNLPFLLSFIFKNYLYNLIFYILCYNVLFSRIKLSR